MASPHVGDLVADTASTPTGVGATDAADDADLAASEYGEEAGAAEEGEEEAHRSAVDAVDGLLDEVELALSRLDDGTYGRCESCGAAISDTDLAERPLVRECRTCGAEVLQPETV